ncbi:MAG: O-antigen ligase family protein [Synergistaceae bacterium]|jgi:hypothetical protein|nr:O-antigen ligase family protein [Synergistaceae bacterium]
MLSDESEFINVLSKRTIGGTVSDCGLMDTNAIWSKIYSALFWMLGFCWLFPFRLRYICFSIIIALFFINSMTVRKQRHLGKKEIVFLVVLLIIITHLSATNIYELARFGYVPFHDVYLTAGMQNLLLLLLNTAWMFVVIDLFIKHHGGGLLIRSLANGANVSVVVLVFIFSSFDLLTSSGRLTISFGANYHKHPNVLAFGFVLFFYLNLLASFYKNNKLWKIYYWLFCVADLIVIVTTMSRTSLGALLLGLVLGNLYYFNKKVNIVLFMSLLLILIYIQAFNGGVISTLVLPERFTLQKAFDDRASGRIETWEDYLTFAKLKDYLVGVGYGGRDEIVLYQKPLQARAAKDKFLFSQVWPILRTHNIYLQALMNFGILGFCIYLCFLYLLFRRIVNYGGGANMQKNYLSMYITFVISGIFQHIYIENLMFISLFLYYIIIKHDANLDCFGKEGNSDEKRTDYV